MKMSKEVTQKQIVAEVTKLLGLKLKSLAKMSKEDLEKLRNILLNPANLAEIAIRGKASAITKIDELLRDPLKGLQILLDMGEPGD